MRKTVLLSRLITMLIIFHAPLAFSLDLTVEILNRKSAQSTIICALFHNADGFPMENKKAIKLKDAVVDSNKNICSFNDLTENKYAVSVLEDLNGNKKVDTTFVGFPKEPWGV